MTLCKLFVVILGVSLCWGNNVLQSNVTTSSPSDPLTEALVHDGSSTSIPGDGSTIIIGSSDGTEFNNNTTVTSSAQYNHFTITAVNGTKQHHVDENLQRDTTQQHQQHHESSNDTVQTVDTSNVNTTTFVYTTTDYPTTTVLSRSSQGDAQLNQTTLQHDMAETMDQQTHHTITYITDASESSTNQLYTLQNNGSSTHNQTEHFDNETSVLLDNYNQTLNHTSNINQTLFNHTSTINNTLLNYHHFQTEQTYVITTTSPPLPTLSTLPPRCDEKQKVNELLHQMESDLQKIKTIVKDSQRIKHALAHFVERNKTATCCQNWTALLSDLEDYKVTWHTEAHHHHHHHHHVVHEFEIDVVDGVTYTLMPLSHRRLLTLIGNDLHHYRIMGSPMFGHIIDEHDRTFKETVWYANLSSIVLECKMKRQSFIHGGETMRREECASLDLTSGPSLNLTSTKSSCCKRNQSDIQVISQPGQALVRKWESVRQRVETVRQALDEASHGQHLHKCWITTLEDKRDNLTQSITQLDDCAVQDFNDRPIVIMNLMGQCLFNLMYKLNFSLSVSLESTPVLDEPVVKSIEMPEDAYVTIYRMTVPESRVYMLLERDHHRLGAVAHYRFNFVPVTNPIGFQRPPGVSSKWILYNWSSDGNRHQLVNVKIPKAPLHFAPAIETCPSLSSVDQVDPPQKPFTTCYYVCTDGEMCVYVYNDLIVSLVGKIWLITLCIILTMIVLFSLCFCAMFHKRLRRYWKNHYTFRYSPSPRQEPALELVPV